MAGRPKEEGIIILQDLDYFWKQWEIDRVKSMWKKGYSLREIRKAVRREGDEVFLLLMHLAREKEIKQRKSHIWGESVEG